nr:hypothetical protein [Tanacetum cinerariifolium]
MATSDKSAAGLRAEGLVGLSSLRPPSVVKLLATKVAQVKAGNVREQAAGLTLHFLLGQL